MANPAQFFKDTAPEDTGVCEEYVCCLRVLAMESCCGNCSPAPDVVCSS